MIRYGFATKIGQKVLKNFEDPYDVFYSVLLKID